MSDNDGVNDDENEDDDIRVSLSFMEWAEVCAALQAYVQEHAGTKAKNSARDAARALQKIDAVMTGQGEAPLDDLMGPSS